MAIGERLKYFRKQKNLTQSDVANMLGLTNSTVSAYEKETRSPDVETLIRLSRIYNVSTDEILGISNRVDADLKRLLESGSMTFDGNEISDKNLRVIMKVVESYLSEVDDE